MCQSLNVNYDVALVFTSVQCPHGSKLSTTLRNFNNNWRIVLKDMKLVKDRSYACVQCSDGFIAVTF